jgi:hypothetical protein
MSRVVKTVRIQVVLAGVTALLLGFIAAPSVRGQALAPMGDSTQLISFLQNLTPAAREQALKALGSLTPGGRQAVEREFNAFSPDMAALAAHGTVLVHRMLPMPAQQKYMNGFFGVSLADKQFADEINYQVLQQQMRNQQLLNQILQQQQQMLNDNMRRMFRR